MLLQRTLFTGPRAWVNQDLYARNCSGTALRARHHITLDGGGSLSTNTYFGRFPASYWQRWTRVTSVNATGTIDADPTVHTTILRRASALGGHARTDDEPGLHGPGTGPAHDARPRLHPERRRRSREGTHPTGHQCLRLPRPVRHERVTKAHVEVPRARVGAQRPGRGWHSP